MAKLLAVDDDRTILMMITRAFEGTDVAVVTAKNGATAMQLLQSVEPDVVLLDVMLPDASGLEVFESIKGADPKLPVIFITAVGDSTTAIEAMKKGAYDYIRKPLDLSQVRETVERALEVAKLMRTPIRIEKHDDEDLEAERLVGESRAMLEVYKLIGQAAPQTISVLIRGESGTGKELIARAIYHHSERANKPFLAINCAAIPENLLESELFGHEKGAFTGADSRHIGKFEQCSGGTIFLDEIGDMPTTLQSKILRLLQDQQFERVGGTQTIQTDVRLIAATNRDLESMIKSGEFREDLYYRLNGVTICLPPLRERREDIEQLLKYFLRRFAKELSKEVTMYSEESLAILQAYPWPGNVREMQAVLKRAILRSKGPVLIPDFLPPEILLPRGLKDNHSPCDTTEELDSELGAFIEKRLREQSESLYAESIEVLETFLISRVLRETHGNQSQAARILGITRGSLRKKIASVGISIDHIVSLDNS